MKLELRPLGACQVADLTRLEQASFTSDLLSPRSFRRFIHSATADGHGAFIEGRLVGYSLMLMRRNSARARIYSLAVDSSQRGKGVGRRLLEALTPLALEHGKTSLQLEVATTNTAAVVLYESLGFRRVASRPGFYEDGGDAWVYRKDLSRTAAGRR